MSAPRVEVRLGSITHNARELVRRLAAKDVAVLGVTKACLGRPSIADAMIRGGVEGLGDSRLENVARLRAAGAVVPITLLRSPSPREVDAVVALAAVSCNSETVVLDRLADAAEVRGRPHGVMLMVEMGDLREGVLPGGVPDLARTVRDHRWLRLAGIGTNLACQSGVVPDDDKMATLSGLADEIEAELGIEVPTVSGGNSANLSWALTTGAVGRINQLRLGESILLGRDPLSGAAIPGLCTDGFRLVAEIIESQEKRAQPSGTIGRTTFGVAATRAGQGTIRQSLLAVGRQDIDPDGLSGPVGTRVLGASSDHLVLDTGTNGMDVGDEVSFDLDYPAVLRAMTSPFVSVRDR